MPTLDIPRPMTREDIRGQRDEVLHGLELPDAIQKMAKDLWSNDPNTEEAFMTDMAVKFRQVICDAVAVGNGTSVTLDFDRSSVRGPVAPIDPYHDAPLVEAFRKYYTEWAELHVRRCREMVVELMLLRQMEGLDDLIQCAEGLDTQWMADN
ncbi:hypothetical protein PAXINDRAFT_168179 [Paxillus involutus ATCC 200175]|nr:hypothetical protein PAXINDRAFT_168179 [Paxillus involutus ATCC 200175]